MIKRIAINQLKPLGNQPAANFKMMEKVIAQNAQDGCDLSVFPEDFLYGVLRNQDDMSIAGRVFDEWVVRFCDMARRHGVAIVPGTLPSLQQGKLYNSTVYIARTGEILAYYSKNNLWLSERDNYQPSQVPPNVFDGALGKMAIMICWDLLDHTLFEAVVRSGVEWVVILAFWSRNQSKDLAALRGVVERAYVGFSDAKLIDSLVKSRVAEYNIGVIFCNFAGVHKYVGVTGPQTAVSACRSQITAPYLAFRQSLRNSKEGTLVCDVGDVQQAIKDFETHYGRRADVISGYPTEARI